MLTLLLNIPLMVAFLALWVGIPMWLILRHPDARRAIARQRQRIAVRVHPRIPAQPRYIPPRARHIPIQARRVPAQPGPSSS